jgi:hypothetical protein
MYLLKYRIAKPILLALFIIAATTYSNTAKAQSSTWTLDATVNNVECYHKIVQCNGVDAVLFRFVNNGSASSISWDSHVFTHLSQPPSVNPVNRQTLSLSSSDIAATGCTGQRALYIKANEVDTSYTSITRFAFQNISVQ